MKLEQNIQKRFVDIITTQEESQISSKAHEVYKNLIYYSFEDVILNAYPRFVKLISKEALKSSIYNFMNYGAKDPLYWRVAGEYKDFILSKNYFEIEYLKDLLDFEFLEIQMYMQKYTLKEQNTFSKDKHYTLSDAVNIFTYSYPIHNPKFDANPSKFEQGEYIVLFYYDAQKEQIISREITPFLKEFLEELNDTNSVLETMKKFSANYEVALDDIIEILGEVLEDFTKNSIILEY